MQTTAIRENVRSYVRDTYLTVPSARADSPMFPTIDCATGFAQWGISPKAAEAHRNFDPNTLAIYPELRYDVLLKPAVMDRFGLSEQQKECIFFGHGSFNLAERLIHKLVRPFRMIGPGPQFNEIPSEFVAAGGEYCPVPIQKPDYAFPFDELKRLLENGASLLYLDNPNNPLGRMIDLGVIADLSRIAEEHGAIVMVDEAYGDFVDDKYSAIHLTSEFTNLAVLRSFSKALGLAAARVGYMVLSAELAGHYLPLDVPFEPSLHSAVLARATLDDISFIEGIREKVGKTKVRIMERFREVGCIILPTHPTTSIMAVYYPTGNLDFGMAGVGIKTEPGSAFRKTHPEWDEHYLRFRMPPEDKVDDAIRALGDAFWSHH